jgi:uncharacterized protein (TIGR03067 family)
MGPDAIREEPSPPREVTAGGPAALASVCERENHSREGVIMKKLSATMVGLTLAVLVTVAAGTALAADKIEGTWIGTGGIVNGEKVPEADVTKLMVTAVFKDGKYSVSIQGRQAEAGTYKADDSKKPATIDLTITEGRDKGKTQLGIYKIDGGNLTVALAQSGEKERPKSFEGGPKIEVSMFKPKK